MHPHEAARIKPLVVVFCSDQFGITVLGRS